MDGSERKTELRRDYHLEDDGDDRDDDAWDPWFSGCTEIAHVGPGGGGRCPWCTGSHYLGGEEDLHACWLRCRRDGLRNRCVRSEEGLKRLLIGILRGRRQPLCEPCGKSGRNSATSDGPQPA